jgi:hypothetical protein
MSSRAASHNQPPSQSLSEPQTVPLLSWQVHLLHRYPRRLHILIITLLLAAGCVWLLFQQVLPVVAALLLLLGTSREYLFPISYILTVEGVSARGLALKGELTWKEARRCLRDRNSLTLTPLATPSRLDAFRGITLRFAPKGQPGDCESILAVIAHCAPELMGESTKNTKEHEEKHKENTNEQDSNTNEPVIRSIKK